MGCAMLGADAKPALPALQKALQDPVSIIRVVSAGALCQLGEAKTGFPVLEAALRETNPGAAREAANTLANLGPEGRALLDKAKTDKSITDDYVQRVLKREP
jgi:HEAT repeat protein